MVEAVASFLVASASFIPSQTLSILCLIYRLIDKIITDAYEPGPPTENEADLRRSDWQGRLFGQVILDMMDWDALGDPSRTDNRDEASASLIRLPNI